MFENEKHTELVGNVEQVESRRRSVRRRERRARFDIIESQAH